MKHFLTILSLCISVQIYSQELENTNKDSLQEGTIYYFDSKKHACGQLYYVVTQDDTISVDRSIENKIELIGLPVEVYFIVSGNGRCETKTLSYIEIK